jgi:hypothetical protein
MSGISTATWDSFFSADNGSVYAVQADDITGRQCRQSEKTLYMVRKCTTHNLRHWTFYVHISQFPYLIHAPPISSSLILPSTCNFLLSFATWYFKNTKMGAGHNRDHLVELNKIRFRVLRC